MSGALGVEKALVGGVGIAMVITLFYDVLKLRRMQNLYDAKSPPTATK